MNLQSLNIIEPVHDPHQVKANPVASNERLDQALRRASNFETCLRSLQQQPQKMDEHGQS